MKKLLLLLLLVSCSNTVDNSVAQQGDFLYQVRGTYTVNGSAEQWFGIHLPLFVLPNNRRIEIRDSGDFVLGEIDFVFRFLERNRHEWGVYEFIFNKERYFIGLRKEGEMLRVSGDNLVSKSGAIGLSEGEATDFADLNP